MTIIELMARRLADPPIHQTPTEIPGGLDRAICESCGTGSNVHVQRHCPLASGSLAEGALG